MAKLELPVHPDGDGKLSLPRPPQRKQRRFGGSTVAIGIVVLAGLAAGGYAASRYFGRSAEQSLFQTEKVVKRDLRVTVTEDGNVESSSNLDLKCRVEGGSQILWVIPDGTAVKKGDKLVTLSSTTIDEKITAQQILVERGKATVFAAAEELAVADIALNEYDKGTFVKDLQTAESAIIVQEQNVKTAENLLNHSEMMFRKGHINQLQLEANRDSLERAKLDLSAAKTARDLLVNFSKPKMIRQLESARDAAKSKLESENRAFKLEKDKLERLEEQKKLCVIYAPQDGTVIYANEQNWRGNAEFVIEEGAAIKEFQTILRLPDLSQMQVKTMVHEAKVGRLRPGMQSIVKIREQEAQGEVSSIMSQAETTWGSSIKSYATYVTIRNPKAFTDLKPNMTAQVTILIRELKDVLTVPLQAVVEKGGKHYCYLFRRGTIKGYEERPVVIGDNNDKLIEIKDGLAAGDDVILNPRATCVEARELVDAPEVERVFGSPDSSRPNGKAGMRGGPPGGEGDVGSPMFGGKGDPSTESAPGGKSKKPGKGFDPSKMKNWKGSKDKKDSTVPQANQGPVTPPAAGSKMTGA
jgi:multidrug efflux pump subunit AcrA (membrane-fusion protein)